MRNPETLFCSDVKRQHVTKCGATVCTRKATPENLPHSLRIQSSHLTCDFMRKSYTRDVSTGRVMTVFGGMTPRLQLSHSDSGARRPSSHSSSMSDGVQPSAQPLELKPEARQDRNTHGDAINTQDKQASACVPVRSWCWTSHWGCYLEGCAALRRPHRRSFFHWDLRPGTCEDQRGSKGQFNQTIWKSI